MFPSQNNRAPQGSVLLPGHQVLINVPVPSQTTRTLVPVSDPTDPYPYNLSYYGGELLGQGNAQVAHYGP